MQGVSLEWPIESLWAEDTRKSCASHRDLWTRCIKVICTSTSVLPRWDKHITNCKPSQLRSPFRSQVQKVHSPSAIWWYDHLSSEQAMKTVQCYPLFSDEAAGEIWNWLLLGAKGLHALILTSIRTFYVRGNYWICTTKCLNSLFLFFRLDRKRLHLKPSVSPPTWRPLPRILLSLQTKSTSAKWTWLSWWTTLWCSALCWASSLSMG